MRYQGRLTHWNDAQGFGFITPNGGGERVFVHIKSFQRRGRRPDEDALLTYERQPDENGRPQAVNVAFVETGPRKSATAVSGGDSPASLILLTGFAAALAFAVMKGKAPNLLAGFYALASAITFGIYALDKSAARRGEWRTPESTLHLLALAGGWPGAVLAQRWLRHKSRKTSFRSLFWVTALANCAALGWLLAAPGAALFRLALGVA